jgi:hypothetical protein
MGKDRCETTPDLSFVKGGRLNMIILQQNKECTKLDASSGAFLASPVIVKSSTMDQVTFHANCVFKLTVDFKKTLPCVAETAVRESTDWVLCSCPGPMAYYNKVEDRLVLQQCVVTVQSNVDQMQRPFGAVLKLDDDEWVIEKVYR